jgi:Family of unknown function (DUF6058)
MGYTEADRAYIRSSYVTLEQACAGRRERPEQVRELIERRLLPRPSYVLDDGSEMVPRDCFALADAAGGPERLHDEFERRYRAAEGADSAELEADLAGYLSGIYGVCLREVTPEMIVRKGVLVASLTKLLAEPRKNDPEWRWLLREQVDEFAPDYDRNLERFERLPTRDLLITAARGRFPGVFS